MSDIELRELQRYLITNPTNYLVWGEYLILAVRAGLFDPLCFGYHRQRSLVEVGQRTISFAEFITGIKLEAVSDPTALYSQVSEAEGRAEIVLHQIRNARKQLSAEETLPPLQKVLRSLYATAPTCKLNTELYEIPAISIDDTYTIYYDERSILAKVQQARRIAFESTPKSVIDFTPQYIVDVAVYSPGTRIDPPDVDIVPILIANSFSELVTKFITSMENEIYSHISEQYYQDFEEEEATTFIVGSVSEDITYNTLKELFGRFNKAPTITRLGSALLLYRSEKLWCSLNFKNKTVRFGNDVISYVTEWDPINIIRARFIDQRLKRILRGVSKSKEFERGGF